MTTCTKYQSFDRSSHQGKMQYLCRRLSKQDTVLRLRVIIVLCKTDSWQPVSKTNHQRQSPYIPRSLLDGLRTDRRSGQSHLIVARGLVFVVRLSGTHAITSTVADSTPHTHGIPVNRR